MPPIKSPEYLEGIPPEESVRQKSEMIDRVEHVADLATETGINPPVPDEDFKYYIFEKNEEAPGSVVTRLSILEQDLQDKSAKESPLVQFSQSCDIRTEGQAGSVSVGRLYKIEIPVRRNDRVDWVSVEPGSHIYENIEDTITYTEEYLEKSKSSLMDKVVVKICSLVFSNIQSQ